MLLRVGDHASLRTFAVERKRPCHGASARGTALARPLRSSATGLRQGPAMAIGSRRVTTDGHGHRQGNAPARRAWLPCKGQHAEPSSARLREARVPCLRTALLLAAMRAAAVALAVARSFMQTSSAARHRHDAQRGQLDSGSRKNQMPTAELHGWCFHAHQLGPAVNASHRCGRDCASARSTH